MKNNENRCWKVGRQRAHDFSQALHSSSGRAEDRSGHQAVSKLLESPACAADIPLLATHEALFHGIVQHDRCLDVAFSCRRRMNAWCLVLALAPGSATFASAAGPGSCPPGEPIQWIADYCMGKIGTDDEITASECISMQNQLIFPSECSAKLHYKRALCDIVVASHARSGTVDACVADPAFSGLTVRKGGVGG
jgi:hypothetical protein